MRALTILIALASTSACLFGEVEGIPCKRDADCASSYFCDIPRDECREKRADFGAPDITVKKLLDPAGAEVNSPVVPPDATSPLTLLPENVGLSDAEGLTLSFAFLECVSFEVDEAALPAVVAPGARAEMPVLVTAGEGCDGLTIIDWFITFSGRESRGTFDLNIKEP